MRIFYFNSSPDQIRLNLENDLRINGNSGLQIGVVPDFPNGSYPHGQQVLSLQNIYH